MNYDYAIYFKFHDLDEKEINADSLFLGFDVKEKDRTHWFTYDILANEKNKDNLINIKIFYEEGCYKHMFKIMESL